MHEEVRRQGPGARVVIGVHGPSVSGPANRYVKALKSVFDEKPRRALAKLALSYDPQCIEAHVALGQLAPTVEARLVHMTAAVAAGDAIWRPVAARYGDRMNWFGFEGVRPYREAIHELGDAHGELGDRQAARWCYLRLLRMNPVEDKDVLLVNWLLSLPRATVPERRSVSSFG